MSVTVTIDLPPELERVLAHTGVDLGRTAKEALAVALFRERKLSRAELGAALGLDRFETDALLKRHLVFVGGLSIEDLELARKSLEEVLGPARRWSRSPPMSLGAETFRQRCRWRKARPDPDFR